MAAAEFARPSTAVMAIANFNVVIKVDLQKTSSFDSYLDRAKGYGENRESSRRLHPCHGPS